MCWWHTKHSRIPFSKSLCSNPHHFPPGARRIFGLSILDCLNEAGEKDFRSQGITVSLPLVRQSQGKSPKDEAGYPIKRKNYYLLRLIWPNLLQTASSNTVKFREYVWCTSRRPFSRDFFILRFHCHAINTAQKNKWETVQWKKPRKRNVIKD